MTLKTAWENVKNWWGNLGFWKRLLRVGIAGIVIGILNLVMLSALWDFRLNVSLGTMGDKITYMLMSILSVPEIIGGTVLIILTGETNDAIQMLYGAVGGVIFWPVVSGLIYILYHLYTYRKSS